MKTEFNCLENIETDILQRANELSAKTLHVITVQSVLHIYKEVKSLGSLHLSVGRNISSSAGTDGNIILLGYRKMKEHR